MNHSVDRCIKFKPNKTEFPLNFHKGWWAGNITSQVCKKGNVFSIQIGSAVNTNMTICQIWAWWSITTKKCQNLMCTIYPPDLCELTGHSVNWFLWRTSKENSVLVHKKAPSARNHTTPGKWPNLFPQTGFTGGMCEPAVSFKKDISLPLRQDTPRTQEAQDAFLEGIIDDVVDSSIFRLNHHQSYFS